VLDRPAVLQREPVHQLQGSGRSSNLLPKPDFVLGDTLDHLLAEELQPRYPDGVE
jgi:hypothetical protein